MSSENSNISDVSHGGPQDVGVTASNHRQDPGSTELRIDGLVAGGRGLARHDGRVWFVRGALPGDVVRVSVLRARKRFVEATIESWVRPSELRREPPCPLQARCGGCPWMPLAETEQRRWKTRLLTDALERIGRLEPHEPEAMRTPVAPLGYRNRMEFAVRWSEEGGPTVGLHGVDADATVVGVDRCAVQSESANAVLATVTAMLGRLAEGAEGERPIERVVLRHSESEGGMIVGMGTRAPAVPGLAALARELVARHAEVRGVVRFHQPHGRRGGTRISVLAGRGRLTERVAGFRFDLPATSFFQVNTHAAEAVLEVVTEMAAPRADAGVLDLYGGLGLYALGLVKKGSASAIVCDADVEAVRCGRQTAARHRLAAVRYVHDDVRRFLGGLRPEAVPPTFVMNPPRTGFGRGVVRAVRGLSPRRLIVVSCDPPTLARDLAELTAGGVYTVERIVPLDLFPQTAHLEVVVSLRRSA